MSAAPGAVEGWRRRCLGSGAGAGRVRGERRRRGVRARPLCLRSSAGALGWQRAWPGRALCFLRGSPRSWPSLLAGLRRGPAVQGRLEVPGWIMAGASLLVWQEGQRARRRAPPLPRAGGSGRGQLWHHGPRRKEVQTLPCTATSVLNFHDLAFKTPPEAKNASHNCSDYRAWGGGGQCLWFFCLLVLIFLVKGMSCLFANFLRTLFPPCH